MKQENEARISEEQCRAWIYEKIFVLRGADYVSRYPKWPGMVGLEIEMGGVASTSINDKKPELLALRGDRSVTAAFVAAEKKFPDWKLNWQEDEPGSEPYLLSVSLAEGGGLSFEPGGQIEFSSQPYPCLVDALASMRKVQVQLDEALSLIGGKRVHFGINPWLTPDEIGLQMPKPRYQAMNRYFSHLSSNGPRMMRQTCTIQVNLDFGADERTLARRYLLANLLAPVATALFGYSSIVDGQISERNSFRASVWQGLDKTRTGFPKNLERLLSQPTRSACAEIYSESVLDARVVFATGLNYEAQLQPISFRDWIKQGIRGVYPTQQDFLTHMTLHFPEVRARGFMELRSVDCQSPAWQDLPATFYCGLLYHEANTDTALDLMLPYLSDLYAMWQQSVFGLKDMRLRSLALKLTELVGLGLTGLPSCFKGSSCERRLQLFREYFIARGRNPADDLRDLAQQLGRVPTPAEIHELDARWLAMT